MEDEITSDRIKVVQRREEPAQNKKRKPVLKISQSLKAFLTVCLSAPALLDLFIYDNAYVPCDIFDVIKMRQTAISHRLENLEGE